MKKATFSVLIILICIPFALATAEKETTITRVAERTGEYGEAPMLAELVAAGELPPVEERLPDEPKVKTELMQEIGQYGGEIRDFAANYRAESRPGHAHILSSTTAGSIVGELAKGYELSDDAKTFTLYLREGAKWSDGHPFTADDILFQIEDMAWTEGIDCWTKWEFPSTMRIEKIDDYTVVYEFESPWPGLPVKFAGWTGHWKIAYSPKHYLQKWHIRYNEDADELAQEEGFDHWYEAFNYHQPAGFEPTRDLDVPSMLPWVPKEFAPTTKVYERNPYYYQVDEEGNQLPYIDRVVLTYVDAETAVIRRTGGESSFALELPLQDYPLLKENEDEGGYRVVQLPGVKGSETAFGLNQNHPDPFLGPLFRDVRFRQALSVAINREEINDQVYYGLAVPRQATTVPGASFYKEEWGRAYAQYDPREANRVLDALGLTERDGDGFRVDPDGKPILLIVEYGLPRPDITELELVKEYWEEVGLKVILKGQSSTIMGERVSALDHIIIIHPYEDVEEISTYLGSFRPAAHGLKEAPAWYQWLRANDSVQAGDQTLADFEGGELPGEEPPEHVKQQWQRCHHEIKQTVFGSEEYIRIAQEIYDYQAKYLYAIGTVGLAPDVCIISNDLGNFPDAAAANRPTYGGSGGLAVEAESFFWKQ